MILLKTVTGIAVEAFRHPRSASVIHVDYVTGKVTTNTGLEITNTWAIGFALVFSAMLACGLSMIMRL